MSADRTLLAITFVIYFLLLFYIGWSAYRKTSNLSDYILGGRRLGRWTTALSAGASDMSGWLLLGLPGYAYLAGLEAGWIALGLILGTYLNWLLVAPRLRQQSVSVGNALTLPEYFEYRFKDHSHLLRFITALFILLFFLFYTSSGLVAGGKLFESVFGLPYHWAVVAGALAILLYTATGGFLAVSWTDLFQGLLMALALVLVAITALQRSGGIEVAFIAIHAHNPALVSPLQSADGKPLSFIAWASLTGWGLGYFGQPHIVVRFMAIRSTALISDARRIAMIWSALCLCAALSIGLSGNLFLANPLIGSDSEKVFIEMVKIIFHPFIAGICLAGILAAIMSTADSQLLVASSAITEDFYKTLLKRDIGDTELMIVGRISVTVIAVIATLLALNPERKVLDLVSYAWAGFGAAFGPALLLSLFWKQMTKTGAIAGIIVGSVTVIIWGRLQGGIFELYELVPAFLFSLISIIITSGFTQDPVKVMPH
ncbi:MAG: sodium/proline symporter PutP [Gammaproteobacteria bacterium]